MEYVKDQNMEYTYIRRTRIWSMYKKHQNMEYVKDMKYV